MVGGDYVLRSWHKIFSGILAASQWYKFKRKYSNIAESQVMIHRRHVCCIGSQQGRDFAVVYGRTVRNPRPPPRPDLALHMAHEGLAITARTVQKGGQTFRIHAKAGLLGVWVRAREADVLPQQIVNRLNSSLVALSHKKDDAAALGEGAADPTLPEFSSLFITSEGPMNTLGLTAKDMFPIESPPSSSAAMRGPGGAVA
eukprot:CAMPEP_0113562320 /NCGR_PEP_ID=MMETSP0015_2-20120614/20460_1 /TAXON_ID=2838 /ORGANISM="Odontella" /LENGTH=199 /DNA_ID=CAMNT_0000464201 /DNA_START=172 /DNA_END=772 /DNA_ORIENTATION=+ /assembly_acc=CAM_ASM_000160